MDVLNSSLDDIINKKKPAVRRDDSSLSDKSLDQIIIERKRDGGRGNGDGVKRQNEVPVLGQRQGRKRQREEVAEEPNPEDVYVWTPLEVIDKLKIVDGFIIELETSKQLDHGLGRSHNWRATMKCGEVSVNVEATFKDLAKQACALEMAKIMKQLDSAHFYPKCAIPEGCFYDNAIFAKLKETIQELALESRYEERQVAKHRRDFFITTYFIGEDEFEGHSFNRDHAMLFAAKAAYETYAQRKIPKEKYHVTEDSVLTGVLRFHESETLHAMRIEAGSAALGRMEDGVPPLKMPAPDTSDEDELLVDDSGRLYVRASDGSNKIKRLMKLHDLCTNEVLVPTKKFLAASGAIRGPAGAEQSGEDETVDDPMAKMDEDELDFGDL